MAKNLKSIATYRNDKEQFIGRTVYVVKKDDIIEGILEKVHPKTIRVNNKLYTPKNAYLNRDEAEQRFVRDGMKLVRESSINWRRLYTMLEELKETKPALFV